MSITDTISRAWADTGGSAAVEFALMGPTLVLFLIGTVDVGALAYQKAEVDAAANAGALYAIHNGGGNTNAIATAATNATPITLSATPSVQILYYCSSNGVLSAAASAGASCGAGAPTAGTYISVSTQANYTPVVSFGALTTLPTTLSASTMVRVG